MHTFPDQDTLPISADESFLPDDTYLPAPRVWQRYGVSSMTLHRWLRDPKMGFPKPTYFGRHRYWRIRQLVEFERSRPIGRRAS